MTPGNRAMWPDRPDRAFAEVLKPLVEKVGGTTNAGAICGVSRQTINLWLAGSVPNAATQRGAVELLKEAKAPK